MKNGITNSDVESGIDSELADAVAVIKTVIMQS